ncbi:MAG: hypothetical protein AAGF12_08660, partial [Myxococcota bacterium]
LSPAYIVPSAPLHFDDDDQLPETPPVVEVPFQELVSGHAEGAIAPSLSKVLQDTAEQLQPVVAALTELEHVLTFKMELATAELDPILDAAVTKETTKVLHEMLVVGLERNRDIIRGHLHKAKDWPEELEAEIREITLGGLAELREQLMGSELSKLRLDVLRRRVAGRRFIRRTETLPGLFHRLKELSARTARALVGEERLEQLWYVLGLPSVAEGTPSAEELSPPREADALPLVYRRLFSAEALDLRPARELEIEKAASTLANSSGNLRTVALVGPDGVGKTALLRAIMRTRNWKEVRRLALDRPVRLADVEQWFVDGEAGHLTVLSGLHWLASAQVGGFEPLRAFIRGIIRDRGQSAWLVSADSLVWDFVREAAPLEDAFAEVIHITPLTSEELEAVVLARHQLSGYGLNFESPEVEGALEDLVARGAGRIQRPYEQFFRELHANSGGLVRDALSLWLSAVDEIDQTEDFVRVGLVPHSPLQAVRRLSDDILVNLLQVCRQGWIDLKTQAQLYRVDSAEAEAQLRRLTNLGLLEKQGQIYQISGHLRGHVVRVLAERGWLT